MTPKVKAEFPLRTACFWISKAPCPVFLPVDLPWHPVVPTAATTNLRHSSFLAPTASRTQWPPATMAYQAPREPVPASSPAHLVPCFMHVAQSVTDILSPPGMYEYIPILSPPNSFPLMFFFLVLILQDSPWLQLCFPKTPQKVRVCSLSEELKLFSPS